MKVTTYLCRIQSEVAVLWQTHEFDDAMEHIKCNNINIFILTWKLETRVNVFHYNSMERFLVIRELSWYSTEIICKDSEIQKTILM